MGSIKPAPPSEPFGETADPRFFWCGEARSAPMAQLQDAIASGSVAVACAGASGSGKTAFLCRLAEQLSAAGVRFIHPDRVVGCSTRASRDPGPRAWEGSKGAGAPGKTAEVLLLDDVDQLSRAEMAQLRDWWTLLRDKREHVALVVSCAASAVDPDSASRRQDLRAMIDTAVVLPPLAPADIEEVIRHRLEIAGLECADVFAEPALDKIAFYAKGTPKRIVQICSRAMALAEESGTFPVGADLVKEAAHQLFLPSHLREFSRKISMGLGPVPPSLGESAAAAPPEPPPAPPPIVETRYERRAYVEPRDPLKDVPTGPMPIHARPARALDATPDQRTIRHDEAAPPYHPGDATLHDRVGAAAAVAPPVARRRRRRGTVSLVMICGLAVVTGAAGYFLAQTDMKPVEVVRIIPHFDTIPSGDNTEAGAPPSGAEPMAAPSTAREAADPVLEAAEPEAEAVEAVPETVEPEREAGEPVPETAEESLQPDPSQDDAALELQAEAADETSLPGATEAADESEDARGGELIAGWTPPDTGRPAAGDDALAEPLLRHWIGEGDDDVPASDPDADVTAITPESTSPESRGLESTGPESTDPESTGTIMEGPGETQQSSPAAPSAVVDAAPSAVVEEREQARDDGERAGAPAAEEALASAPVEEEPAIRWQFDRTVMRAQALLAQLDYYRGAIDGLFGDRTLAAVRDFQRSISMAETGELTEAVLAALEQQASAARTVASAREQEPESRDAVIDAAEDLQVIDIMSECRGRDSEWVYIAAINRHVLCAGLSAGAPNPVPTR
jgi:type II secretory pathway predicted ATPase ExeA